MIELVLVEKERKSGDEVWLLMWERLESYDPRIENSAWNDPALTRSSIPLPR